MKYTHCTNLSDLPAAVRGRATGDEVELDVRPVLGPVRELGRHPRQPLHQEHGQNDPSDSADAAGVTACEEACHHYFLVILSLASFALIVFTTRCFIILIG